MGIVFHNSQRKTKIEMSKLNCCYIFLAILPLLCYTLPSPQSDSAGGKPFKCSVEEKNSKTTQECQFPFKLNEKIFTNCTDFQDPDGRLWCSTKVTKTDRQHVGGGSYWGYCDIKDGKCPGEEDDTKSQVLLGVLDIIKQREQNDKEKTKGNNDILQDVLSKLDDN